MKERIKWDGDAVASFVDLLVRASVSDAEEVELKAEVRKRTGIGVADLNRIIKAARATERRRRAAEIAAREAAEATVTIDDFLAYMPMHDYIQADPRALAGGVGRRAPPANRRRERRRRGDPDQAVDRDRPQRRDRTADLGRPGSRC